MQKQVLGKLAKWFGIIFLCILISQGVKVEKLYAKNITDWNEVSSADWMKYINGTKKLSEITIPGSHDSATEYIPLSYIARCQESSIAEQLETGVRFLDIRLKSKGEKETLQFELCHGFLPCKTEDSIFSKTLTFESVLTDCYEFLKNHPSETIIMAIKHEDGKHSDKEVQAAIHKLLKKDEKRKWYLQNEDPILDETRGKIILARRYEDANDYGELKGGLNFLWKNQDGTDIAEVPYEESEIKDGSLLLVQDRYEYETDDKWEAVQYGLEQSERDRMVPEKFFLNYLSTKGGKVFGHPKKYANELNQKLLEYELQKNSDYGILIMDFVTEELSKKVYQSNALYNQ